MSIASDANMEEISLDDEDRDCLEYRVLMVFAQRNLSVSKYEELMNLERQSLTGGIRPESQGATSRHAQRKEANGHKGGEDTQIKRGSAKTKRKKLSWRRRLVLNCLQGAEPEEPSRVGLEKVQISDSAHTGDAEREQVSHIAGKLFEIIDNRPHPMCFFRSFSVEADGVDDEAKLIEDIVALLRQSGDRLNEQMKQDKTFGQSFKELFSYSFFKKVTEHYLENLDLSGENKVQQQSVKLAYTMDITTKLTAIDNHPMNRVMGFGVKYLKEHFSPWIENHGGWEKALGFSNEDELE